MKKWITRIVIAVVIVVVVVVAGVFFYINSLAKSAIEKGATYAMGVQTTVGGVSVGVLRGRLDLDDLDIANPKGYTSDHFLNLGRGEAAVTLGSLMDDTVEVPYIRLNRIDMNLEEKDGKANFQDIMDNLAKLKSTDESKEEKKGKGYVVRELNLTDITVHAAVGGKTIPIKIDQIKLTDIGSGEGQSVDMEQLTGVIMKAIFEALLKHPDALPGVMAGKLQDGVKNIGDLGVAELKEAVTVIEGQVAEEGIKKVTDEAGKVVDDVADGIGGLFKKKEPKE